MKYSISLNKLRKNLTKTTAVAAVIGIATCLLPASAQAQRTRGPEIDTTGLLQFSGNSNVQTDVNVEFFLDTSVENTNSLGPDQGEFPGAILNFTDSGNPNNKLSPLSYSSGTLTTSRLTVDPTTRNFPGFDYGFKTITDNTIAGNFSSNTGLRYDVRFGDGSERLTLFIPAVEPGLFNSLSGLINASGSRYTELQGVVSRPDIGVNERFLVDGLRRPFRVSLVTVPEPTATASLLGVGAMGAVSLLKSKRNKVYCKRLIAKLF